MNEKRIAERVARDVAATVSLSLGNENHQIQEKLEDFLQHFESNKEEIFRHLKEKGGSYAKVRRKIVDALKKLQQVEKVVWG